MKEINKTYLKGLLYTRTTQKSPWDTVNVQEMLSISTQLVRGKLGFKTDVSTLFA